MNTILYKQQELQKLIAEVQNTPEINISDFPSVPNGVLCEHVKSHAFSMQEEVVELLIAIGGGDRAILKPWSKKYPAIYCKEFIPTDAIKSEAIDMLCFCLNICLAVGITPGNIDDEYNKVLNKNIIRQTKGY
jgi:NTP pyrophosphatase (non-canonical NTP hydrolase)